MAQPMDTSESLCETRAVDENANGLSWGIIDPNGLADIIRKGTFKVCMIIKQVPISFKKSTFLGRQFHLYHIINNLLLLEGSLLYLVITYDSTKNDCRIKTI